MMAALGNIPELRRRTKAFLFEGAPDATLWDEIYLHYNNVKAIVEDQRLLLEKQKAATDAPPLPGLLGLAPEAHVQRIYGVTLVVSMIFGILLSTLDPFNEEIQVDGTYWAREILLLAEQGKAYRPLGSSYITLCLIAAWTATADAGVRAEIETVLQDYMLDYSWGQTFMASGKELQRASEQLRLIATDQPGPGRMI